METKIRNLTFIVIFGFVITFILLIGLYFKTGNTATREEASSNNNSSSTSNYDVSKMEEVDVDGALALFDSKEVEVLYIGRSNCSACIATVPYLNQVQEELKYTTKYLDLNVIMKKYQDMYDSSDDDYAEKVWAGIQSEIKPLTDLLTVVGTANGESGQIGKLFYDNGFTPTVAVIKDGKMVDGFIGSRGADDIKTMIEKYL